MISLRQWTTGILIESKSSLRGGVNELIQGIKEFYSVFPDNTHTIEDIISEGDKIAVRITTSGSQKKGYRGIPATGKKATNSAMHMMVISDGKIRRSWKLEDTPGLMTQLGYELKPVEAKKKQEGFPSSRLMI